MTLLDRADGRTVGFATALASHGARVALASDDGPITYEDLARRADRVATGLGSTRRLVALPLTNHVESVVAYLGALRGGHVVLVTPPRADHLDDVLARFDPDVVLHPSGAGPLVLDERRVGTAHALHPDLAVLLGTSGSTGSPRLVRLSHENLDANAEAIATMLGLGPGDRAITSLPLHYCYGLSVLHSHLRRGAATVITDRSVVDRCFWDAVRTWGVTTLAGVPHTFDLLERSPFAALDAPSLRLVTQAGGRLAPERVVELAARGAASGWQLVVMYGQTEATARMAYLPPALAPEHPTTVGVAIPGGRITLAPVADAAPGVGEVVYEGPNVMLGYAEHPADLAAGRTVETLRTGDLGRWTDDGLLELVGRRSRFAKVFGLRIDLDHLEARLRAEGLTAVCVADDARVLAAVTDPGVAERARASLLEVTALPRSRVAVVVLEAIPRRPNGKVDHAAVVRAGAQAERANDAVPESPGLHPGVAAAVHAVLPGRFPRPDDTFVGLGGDSLSYVEVSIALEAALGHLPAQWETTPLGHLAPAPGSRRRGAQVDTSVVVRAVAITLVVGLHIKLFDVLGGAHLLLAIAGWNFGRFTTSTLARLRSVARIAIPSALWLALVALTVAPRVHLDHVLLVHGWTGRDGHGGYWYVEAIVQILLPLVALLAVPAVARLERARPLVVPGGLLVAGLSVRFGLLELPTVEPHDIRPHDIVWLFALGWVAGRVRTPAGRAIVSALALLSIPGYFGEPAREALVTVGFLLVLWVPTVRVPRPAAPLLGKVAGASLYVYLTHWQVFPPVREAAGGWAALAASLAFGVGAWWAVGLVEAQAARALARRAQGASAPEPTAALAG